MNKTKILITIAFGITLNVTCAFLALTLQIPFYMDSIGTIFVAGLLGPKYAIITGILGNIASGISSDIYSFYYIPVQITTGYFAGRLYHTKWLNGKHILIGNLVVSIPSSILSAIITSFVFHGITTSGSSILTMMLYHAGLNLTFSVLVIQIITDYCDKLLAIFLTKLIMKRGNFNTKWRIKWKDTVK